MFVIQSLQIPWAGLQVKIEDIEMALHRLASLQLDSAEIFEEQFPESSSNPFLPGSRGSFAPGLQRDSAGDFCARLPGFENVVAKKIVASRLDFKGEPTFDPVPFLDERSKAVFQRPIQQALTPGESREDPPNVRVYGSDAEVMQLLKKLDSTGRLGILRDHEVLEGYQAGLFCVPKSSTQDRLIFDSRPFNTGNSHATVDIIYGGGCKSLRPAHSRRENPSHFGNGSPGILLWIPGES